jgi:glycosyltransferase involved in cell wall biosynthesis
VSRDVGAKISVCLLAYNHVGLIESTVRSILDQTVAGQEILISDDQSEDGTWERIQALAAEDAGSARCARRAISAWRPMRTSP